VEGHGPGARGLSRSAPGDGGRLPRRAGPRGQDQPQVPEGVPDHPPRRNGARPRARHGRSAGLLRGRRGPPQRRPAGPAARRRASGHRGRVRAALRQRPNLDRADPGRRCRPKGRGDGPGRGAPQGPGQRGARDPPGQPPDQQGRGDAGLRHPRRTVRAAFEGPLPHRRRAPGGGGPAQPVAGGRDLAHQDHGQAQHRGNPPPPGRPDQARHPRQGGRFSRLHGAHQLS
jgi:hypothetical protein